MSSSLKNLSPFHVNNPNELQKYTLIPNYKLLLTHSWSNIVTIIRNRIGNYRPSINTRWPWWASWCWIGQFRARPRCSYPNEIAINAILDLRAFLSLVLVEERFRMEFDQQGNLILARYRTIMSIKMLHYHLLSRTISTYGRTSSSFYISTIKGSIFRTLFTLSIK